MKKTILAGLILTALQFLNCVTIETGQTADEAARSSEYRAKQIRADWANQLRGISANDISLKVGELYRKTTEVLYDLGKQTSERWQEGEKGRGEKIDAAEMRKMVDLWLTGEKPILKAYEDNLEYALSLLIDQNADNYIIEKVEGLLDSYYSFYSTALIPQSDLESYKYELEKHKTDSDRNLNEFYDFIEKK